MASSGEGGFDLPSSRRHGMGAPPDPIATTPWLEEAPTTQAMTTIPPRALASWPNTGLPSSDGALFGRGNVREPTLCKPTLCTRQRNGEPSTGKQATTMAQLHEPP
jgi:hypothetical protein